MPIEWPLGLSSTMSMEVVDNTLAPVRVLDAAQPFTIRVTFSVPPPLDQLLGGSFQLRAFAESIGPGPEMQIGVPPPVPPNPVVLLVNGGLGVYTVAIPVSAGQLLGEGAPFPGPGGVPVSGVYKLVVVLQHLNPAPTTVSGFAETSVRMFRTP